MEDNHKDEESNPKNKTSRAIEREVKKVEKMSRLNNEVRQLVKESWDNKIVAFSEECPKEVISCSMCLQLVLNCINYDNNRHMASKVRSDSKVRDMLYHSGCLEVVIDVAKAGKAFVHYAPFTHQLTEDDLKILSFL
jgi:hypothetical protein